MQDYRLPADPLVLILGVTSLFMLFFVCCCGFLIPFSLGLAIVGWVLAGKSLRLYDAQPQQFTEGSRSIVSVGKIICMISALINVILALLITVFFLFLDYDIIEKFSNQNLIQQTKQITTRAKDSVVHDSVYDDALFKHPSTDTVATPASKTRP